MHINETIKKLTPKQLHFCREYLISGNATASALDAGYSEKSAHVQGSRLLNNANVSAFLNEAERRLAKAHEVKAKDVIRRRKIIANANLADYYDFSRGVPLVKLEDLTRDQCYALKRIRIREVGNSRVIDIELEDRGKSLDALGKMCGLYDEERSTSKQPTVINVISPIPGPPGDLIGK